MFVEIDTPKGLYVLGHNKEVKIVTLVFAPRDEDKPVRKIFVKRNKSNTYLRAQFKRIRRELERRYGTQNSDSGK